MKILKSMAYTAVAAVATYNVYLAADIQQVKSDLTFDTIELTASGAEPGGDNSRIIDDSCSPGSPAWYAKMFGDSYGPIGGGPGRDPWISSISRGNCESGSSYISNTYSSGGNVYTITTNTFYDSNCNVTSFSEFKYSSEFKGPQVMGDASTSQTMQCTYTTTYGQTTGGQMGAQIQITAQGSVGVATASSSQSLNGNISTSSTTNKGQSVGYSVTYTASVQHVHCAGAYGNCFQGALYTCAR